jgi:DNA-directed RNA polymerase subunit RPC12/RpoP
MESRVMKLCCQGCGADLQVSEEVRFITCNYCQSKLEIVRDVSVTHTRVLEKLERTTERIAGNLKVIELQNDLERMDREWVALRENLLLRGRNGELYEPSMGAAVSLGIVIGLIGVVIAIASLYNAVPIGLLLGLGILALSIWVGRSGADKATEFRKLKQRYEVCRQRMLALIEAERRR